MIIKDQISKDRKRFILLCRNHSIRYLYAFGSSVTGKFDENASDIDLLVEIDAKDPIDRGEKLLELWDQFEAFFQRKVDLLTESSIHNPFLRKNIDSTKVLIYNRSEQKMLV